MTSPSSSLGDTVRRWINGYRTAQISRLLLVIAAVVFAGGLYLSIDTVNLHWHEIRWPPFVTLILLAGPATLALNTVETLAAVALFETNAADATRRCDMH